MSRLREVLRWLWAVLLRATGASAAARRQLLGQRAIVVLALHRVLDDSEFHRTNSLAGMVMRRCTFERLCAYVKQRCDSVDIHREEPREETGRVGIAITFDDGWIDNRTVVLPIVQAYGIPMAAFVCPGLLDRDVPFWPERVAGSLRTMIPGLDEAEIECAISRCKSSSGQCPAEAMTHDGDAWGPDRSISWAHLEELAAAGVTIGAHTQTHQLLTNVSLEAGRREVFGAKAFLERQLHQPCDQFAYPNGNHSAATRELLEEAGFAHAFTMERGAWTPGCDRLRIPRVNMAEDDITGPGGRFSTALFEYAVFWKVLRAERARRGRR
ncbi:MAG TPA: polysaccharide deacetylase family protein [Bryobacteraceae bacterium]|nr:polysaccharide deacetylase family protein [Bryobacteraceae bacterium]